MNKMKEIIEKNLKLIKGVEIGEMQHLLNDESMGSNAGFWKNCSCAGANFFYDKNTGEIKYFGNIQHVPEAIKSKYSEACFRVAMDIGRWKENIMKQHIVNIFYYEPLKNPPARARNTLEECVRLYNQEFGFSEKELEEKE